MTFDPEQLLKRIHEGGERFLTQLFGPIESEPEPAHESRPTDNLPSPITRLLDVLDVPRDVVSLTDRLERAIQRAEELRRTALISDVDQMLAATHREHCTRRDLDLRDLKRQLDLATSVQRRHNQALRTALDLDDDDTSNPYVLVQRHRQEVRDGVRPSTVLSVDGSRHVLALLPANWTDRVTELIREPATNNPADWRSSVVDVLTRWLSYAVLTAADAEVTQVESTSVEFQHRIDGVMNEMRSTRHRRPVETVELPDDDAEESS